LDFLVADYPVLIVDDDHPYTGCAGTHVVSLLFGRGWDLPPGDPPTRWVGPDAVFWLIAAQPQTVTLQLQGMRAGGSREIVLTGPTGVLAGATGPVTLGPFALPAGRTQLQLDSPTAPLAAPTGAVRRRGSGHFAGHGTADSA
jgi:hypothetical protein